MMYLYILILLGSVSIAECKFVQGAHEWTHKLDLGEGGGRVRWKNSDPGIGEDRTRWLTMEVFTKTNGYVGVGFSPHGGMAGADIVIGWVDSSGTAHLKVCKFFIGGAMLNYMVYKEIVIRTFMQWLTSNQFWMQVKIMSYWKHPRMKTER